MYLARYLKQCAMLRQSFFFAASSSYSRPVERYFGAPFPRLLILGSSKLMMVHYPSKRRHLDNKNKMSFLGLIQVASKSPPKTPIGYGLWQYYCVCTITRKLSVRLLSSRVCRLRDWAHAFTSSLRLSRAFSSFYRAHQEWKLRRLQAHHTQPVCSQAKN